VHRQKTIDTTVPLPDNSVTTALTRYVEDTTNERRPIYTLSRSIAFRFLKHDFPNSYVDIIIAQAGATFIRRGMTPAKI